MSDNDPTQPMEPQFYPPPLPWEYQVDLSRRAGANVYKNAEDELVVQVASRWHMYQPETNMFLMDGNWMPMQVWTVGELHDPDEDDG